TFSKISSWLEECCTCHLSCERPTAIPLPSRVLDLSPPRKQRQIRLISGEGKRGQWVALSHAWGGFQPLRTTKETLAVHQAGIKWSELPPTFQDAVIITKTLGFKYLWIDSLCIIQNSPEDWDREAATMASVYGNAAITICAEAAANSQCGIFKSANNRRGIDVRLPANNRAWVLQESLLSPRVIIYTADQVKWSCRTAEKFERGREEGEGYLLGHRKLLRCWYDIVERYGPCNITKAEDRLPAIAGVAKRISALTGFSYLAGLWLEDIVQGLCWFSENGLPQTSSKYLGPTWSWVCM
ncbi:HET-domain-containing protein, partial [Hyaloscypha hepaticicola]